MKYVSTFSIVVCLLVSRLSLTCAQTSPEPEDWGSERINAQIITMTGDIYAGQLLFADSNSLALWMSVDPFSPTHTEIPVLILEPAEIDQILLRRSGNVAKKTLVRAGAGAGVGLVVGTILGSDPGILTTGDVILIGTIFFGAIGSISGFIAGQMQGVHLDKEIGGQQDKYLQLLPRIRKKYVLLQDPASVQLTDFSPPAHSDPIPQPFNAEPPSGISRLHIGGGIGGQFSILNRFAEDILLDQGLVPEEANNRVWGQSVYLSFSIRPNWRLGLGAQFQSSQWSSGDFSFMTDSTRFVWSGSQSFQPYEFLFTLDHVFSPLSRPLDKRIELSLGGGLSMSYLDVFSFVRGSGQLDPSIVITNVEERQRKNHDLWLPGLHLRAAAEYYLLPEISLFAQLGGTLGMNGKIPANLIPIEGVGDIGLPPHNINASKLHALFGLRFHVLPKAFSEN